MPTITSYKKYIYLLLSAIIVVLLMLGRDINYISYSKYLLSAIVVGLGVFMSYENIVYYICFLFPLTHGLPGGYIYAPLILLMLIKHSYINSRGFWIFFVIVIFELIHYPFYDFETNIPEIIKYFSAFFILIYILTNEEEILDNRKCVLWSCVGYISLFLIILISTSQDMMLSNLIETENRIGNTFDDMEGMHTFDNPNGLGMSSIVVISSALTLYLRKQLSIPLTVFLCAVSVIIGLFSVSRAWLVTMLLLVVLYAFTIQKNNKSTNFLLIALMGIGIYYFLNSELFYGAFERRFTDSNITTMGGRTNITSQYIKYLLNHPLSLFIGIGAMYQTTYTGIDMAIHNGTLQVIIAYGIIGLLLIVSLLFRYIRKYYDNRFRYTIYPLVLVLFILQSGQVLNISGIFYLLPVLNLLKIKNNN